MWAKESLDWMKVQLNFLAEPVSGGELLPVVGAAVMNAANIAAKPTYLRCRHETASDAHAH